MVITETSMKGRSAEEAVMALQLAFFVFAREVTTGISSEYLTKSLGTFYDAVPKESCSALFRLAKSKSDLIESTLDEVFKRNDT